MSGVGVADTVTIFDHTHPVGKRRTIDTSFVAPRAVELRQPDIAVTDRETSRDKAVESHLALFLMRNFRPGFDHILIRISTIADCDIKRIISVFQFHRRDFGSVFLTRLIAVDLEIKSHVAIGMNGTERGFAGCIKTIGRISVGHRASGCTEIRSIIVGDQTAVVEEFKSFPLFGIKNKRCRRCVELQNLAIGAAGQSGDQ